MKKLATALLTLSATTAVAHTGHDTALCDGIAHWTLSPLHGLGVIALAAVLYGVRSYLRKE